MRSRPELSSGSIPSEWGRNLALPPFDFWIWSAASASKCRAVVGRQAEGQEANSTTSGQGRFSPSCPVAGCLCTFERKFPKRRWLKRRQHPISSRWPLTHCHGSWRLANPQDASAEWGRDLAERIERRRELKSREKEPAHKENRSSRRQVLAHAAAGTDYAFVLTIGLASPPETCR